MRAFEEEEEEAGEGKGGEGETTVRGVASGLKRAAQ
jgi:hypothetical protein